MSVDASIDRILRDAYDGRPITRNEATLLLALPEASLEASPAARGSLGEGFEPGPGYRVR
jgi:hypothetical protein